MKTKLTTALCLLVLTLGSLNVCRAEDNSVAAITDVVLVRPGCFVATIIGSACFVVALPFAAASGSIKSTADTLVLAPAQATFTRPVGDFSTIN